MCLSVAKSLLAAGNVKFRSTLLTVVEPPGDYSDDVVEYSDDCDEDDDDDDDDDDVGTETASNAVRVTSIPRSTSLQMLRTFLESDKIGVGPIRDIEYSDGDDSAIVYFQHASGNACVCSQLTKKVINAKKFVKCFGR